MYMVHKEKKLTSPGFTLIEMLIALVIVGLIASAGVFTGMKVLDMARRGNTETKLRQLKQVVTLFNAHTNRYPATLNDLLKQPQGEEGEGWQGPYVDNKEALVDGWGNKFVYKLTPGTEHPYDLYSYGSSAGKESDKKTRINAWKL